MIRAPHASVLQGDNHLEISDRPLQKRHFIMNKHSEDILVSEWQARIGRAGNMTGSEDQCAATERFAGENRKVYNNDEQNSSKAGQSATGIQRLAGLY